MNRPLPPRSAVWLLNRVIPVSQRDEILADLAEVLARRHAVGRLGWWWYWWQTSAFTARYVPERLAERLGRRPGRNWRPSRPKRKASTMETLLPDVRLALRGLLRERVLSATVIVTLALGIGSTTAVFSVVNGVLLRPLPFHDPGRVMMVWENDRVSDTEREGASVPDYYDFLERNTVFEDIAMFNNQALNFAVPGSEPQRMTAVQVSHSYDDLLGIRLLMGRGITPVEDQPGGPLVAMISEGVWRTVFGTDPDILRTIITLNDQAYDIIGVVSHDVSRVTSPATDLWVPLQLGPTSTPRATHNVQQIARLKSEVTLEQAQQEMSTLAAQLEEDYPENAGRGAFVEPLQEVVRGPIRPALLVLFGAVLAVLLIACANVANLLLARGSRRATDIAVHAALGASPLRLLQRFIAESIVLVGLSWILGIGFALISLFTIVSLAPAEMGSLVGIRPDIPVLGFTLLASGCIAFGFGLLPAWQVRRSNLQANLREGRREGGAGSIERMRFQRLLVVAQMAMAFVLLLGSSLLINSFWRLQRVDPGFKPAAVVRMAFRLPVSRYPRDFSVYPNWPEIHDFNNRLLGDLETTPGVRSAALAINHPLDGGFTNSFVIEGREDESADQPEMRTRLVSSEYFRTLGVPLVAGRMFDSRDRGDAPFVMLLNQAAVDRFFPKENAIGARIRFWGMQREVIGIVGNERFDGLAEDTPPAMYAAVSQAPPVGGQVLLIQAEGDPLAIVPAARQAVWDLDPGLAIYDIATMEETVSRSLAAERFTMVLLSVFGAVAVFLAVVGVYGVLAYQVARRRHELGVRMAIGASSEQVVRMVLRQGMVLAAFGMVLGLGGALALSGSLRSLLYDLSPLDPATYGTAIGLLGGAALLAGFIPARRASKVNPVDAMRSE